MAKADTKKSPPAPGEALMLTKLARTVAAEVRADAQRLPGDPPAEPDGVASDGDLLENDVNLLPRTAARRRASRNMAATFAAGQFPSPEKVERDGAALEKWQAAAALAAKTGKMANTLAKALAKRSSKRWQFVDFLGPNGRESAGVVDIVAIRKKSTKQAHAILKPLDLFDIILIQVKGGSAPKPTNADILRLKTVKDVYNAKSIVLFQWQKGVASGFYQLDEHLHAWEQRTTAELFG